MSSCLFISYNEIIILSACSWGLVLNLSSIKKAFSNALKLNKVHSYFRYIFDALLSPVKLVGVEGVEMLSHPLEWRLVVQSLLTGPRGRGACQGSTHSTLYNT